MTKSVKKDQIRIDDLLVLKGLTPDLPKAKALIMAGQVIVDDQRVRHPSQLFEDNAKIRLKLKDQHISRAGKKLSLAIQDLKIKELFQNASVLDAGASTGGFTETALGLGAVRVIACDVGRNQLAWSLRSDPRVEALERTDIRSLTTETIGKIDIVLADLSFISLARMVPHIVHIGGPEATYLLLVKPQFELAREQVPQGGVVKDHALRMEALEGVLQALRKCGIEHLQFVDSRVPGRNGNIEIFVLGRAKHQAE